MGNVIIDMSMSLDSALAKARVAAGDKRIELEQTSVSDTDGVAHVVYRVIR